MNNGQLHTARLTLRPLELSDVDALWPYVSNPELPRFMTWNAHEHRDETEQFVRMTVDARNAATSYVFTIVHDGGVVGLIGLHDVTRVVRAWRVDRAELGYWCGPEFHGRGFATEAAREVVRFGFEDLALHKITVGSVTENVPSRRVIEKIGFRFTGEQRDHFFRFGVWWNHRSYEMLVDEWRANDVTAPRT